jgi:putative transposase
VHTSKFSEHQIIAILKAVEGGRTVRDVCLENEVGEATYYQYRYRRRPSHDDEIVKLLLELAHQRPEEGFPKLFKQLRRQGRAGVGITSTGIACIAG